MTITPAVLTLLGDKAWWMPTWLDKLVPNMDVEGATLLDTLEEEAEQPAAEHDEQAETAKSTAGASS